MTENPKVVEDVESGVTVEFWGVRGSLPTPGPDTVRYGGNTSCVSLAFGTGEHLILDAGTGIRRLGEALSVEDGDLFILVPTAIGTTYRASRSSHPFIKRTAESTCSPLRRDASSSVLSLSEADSWLHARGSATRCTVAREGLVLRVPEIIETGRASPGGAGRPI